MRVRASLLLIPVLTIFSSWGWAVDSEDKVSKSQPWPAWYERNVVNTLKSESGPTLMIALGSLPSFEELPAPVIEVLVSRLADNGLSKDNREEILRSLTYAEGDLAYIVPALMPYGIKNADSGVWDVIEGQMTAHQFAAYSKQLEALARQNEESKVRYALSHLREKYIKPSLSLKEAFQQFEEEALEGEDEYHSTDELISHLQGLLASRSKEVDSYLTRLFLLLADPRMSGRTMQIEEVIKSVGKVKPGIFARVINLLKVETTLELNQAANRILKYRDANAQSLDSLLEIRSKYPWLVEDGAYGLGRNVKSDEQAKIFTILDTSIQKEDIQAQKIILEIVSKFQNPERKHLAVLRKVTVRNELLLDAFLAFGVHARQEIHEFLTTLVAEREHLKSPYVGYLPRIAVLFPEYQGLVNSVITSLLDPSVEETSALVELAKSIGSLAKAGYDLNWIEVASFVNALESPGIEWKYQVLDPLIEFAHLLKTEQLIVVFNYMLNTDADESADRQRVASILTKADHSSLLPLLPELYKLLASTDQIDRLAVNDHQQVARAVSRSDWALRLMSDKRLTPLLEQELDQLIELLNNSRDGRTHCGVMQIILTLSESAVEGHAAIVSKALEDQFIVSYDHDLYTSMLYGLAIRGKLSDDFTSDLLKIVRKGGVGKLSNNELERTIFALRTLQLMGISSYELNSIPDFRDSKSDVLRYEYTKLLVKVKGGLSSNDLRAMLPYLFQFNSKFEGVKSYFPNFIGYSRSEEIYLPCDFNYFGSKYDSYFFLSDWVLGYGPLSLDKVSTLLDYAWLDTDNESTARYLYRIIGPGTKTSESLLAVFHARKHTFDGYVNNKEKAFEEVKALLDAWETIGDQPLLRQGILTHVTTIALAHADDWNDDERRLLKEFSERIPEHQGATISSAIERSHQQWITQSLVSAIGGHVLFWIVLITWYPYSSWLQARMFWDRRARKYFGLFYVELLLTTVPWLRNRLLRPFEPALAEKAQLSGFDPKGYFADSPCKVLEQDERGPLSSLNFEGENQVVIQGVSGLGKTMFLRHLFYEMSHGAKTIRVFLKAAECKTGSSGQNAVVESIRELMDPLPVDVGFLETLLYTGVFTIYIDGLNEASLEFRAELSKFLRSYKQTKVIITTQPIDWIPPENTLTVQLLPLTPEQRLNYLSLCYDNDEKLQRDTKCAFLSNAEKFVSSASVHASSLPKDHRMVVDGVLSNPMDLTFCAWLISMDIQPNFLRLQEQQVELMAAEFIAMNPQYTVFPIAEFAEAAYELTKHPYAPPIHATDVNIHDTLFQSAIACMGAHRLVVPAGEDAWRFRHDKVRDFFVLQTFLGNGNARPSEYMGDSRFAGVYFLLAYYLPVSSAKLLREELIDYAFANNDFEVSRSFVEGLHLRAAEEIRPDELN